MAGEGPLDEARAPSPHTLSPQSGQITTVPEAKTRCFGDWRHGGRGKVLR